jgi:hypothetical protein
VSFPQNLIGEGCFFEGVFELARRRVNKVSKRNIYLFSGSSRLSQFTNMMD